MKERNIHTGKNILFAIVMLFLLLPLIQQKLKLFKEGELHKVIPPEEPVLSLKNYFNGEYQEKKETYFNNYFGFRKLCVRLNNQIDYSLFNKANAKRVIVGKDNYLYEENYIETYLGKHFIGHDKIAEKVKKLRKVQDTLKKLDIDLFIAIAPSKAIYYSEYIPDKYFKTEKTITNREVYLKEFAENQINFIEFDSWFLKMKDTVKYPLFPKTGVHWSRYGEFLAIDSIINYIEYKRQVKLPKMMIDKIEISKEPKGVDNDIEKAMNLLFEIPNVEMAYPQYSVMSDSTTTPTKMLVVGDSFYWDMFLLGFSEKLFDNGQFWYYNKRVDHSDPTTPKTVSELNVQKEVEKNNVVMIMITDSNLPGFAFGFIDNLYDIYFNN